MELDKLLEIDTLIQRAKRAKLARELEWIIARLRELGADKQADAIEQKAGTK